MNHNIRIAKQLVRIAKMLVAADIDADDGKKTWKILRVMNNGTREIFIKRFQLDSACSDLEKMDEFERQLRNAGCKMPDDCDFYADGDQYVLRHDDGRIEYRMCIETKDKESLNRSKYFVLKCSEDNKKKCVDVITMVDSDKVQDKTRLIVGWCKKRNVNVRMVNVEYVPEREWFTVKDNSGNLLYLFSKKRRQN